MDLDAFYAPGRVLLDLRPPNGPQQLVVSVAGFLGLMGVSRPGLSVNVNALLSLRRSASGVPVAFVVRRLLTQPGLRAAQALLSKLPHASGQNYVIADHDDLFDGEASAGGVSEWARGASTLAHTNHPLISTDLFSPDHAEPSGNSLDRMGFASARLEGAATLAELEAILADRETPVCHVGSVPAGVDTFAGMSVEMSAPPRVRIAPGPPAVVGFNDVEWDS